MQNKLDELYSRYNKIGDINDPVNFPHACISDSDKEIAAFIAAIFAYGSETQIRNTLQKIALVTENKPAQFLTEHDDDSLRDIVTGIYHRFYSEEDVFRFFLVLKQVIQEEGSLENLFMKCQVKNDLRLSIAGFHEELGSIAQNYGRGNTPGIKFMFPDARKGSACKRTNLFLRWMVRKDNVDFGLWECLSSAELIIPVDTHIAKVSQLAGFTTRKQADWKMAEEITASLRKYNYSDPVKYDFSLCHLGMEKNTEIFLKNQ